MTRRRDIRAVAGRAAWGALLFSFAREGLARAEQATTEACLAASDAWIAAAKQHKPRVAREALALCAQASCPADVRKECSLRLKSVSAQIPTIVFELADAHGSRVAGGTVAMDGEVLTARLDDTPLAVDPGEHTFTFETEGHAPFAQKLTIEQGQKGRREVVALPPEVDASVATTVQTPAVTGAREPREDESRGRPFGTQRTLAVTAAGVGVVGLAVGTAFGVVMLGQRSTAQQECPNLCPTQAGVDQWRSATSSGNIATAGFIVGAAGVALGTTLWITAPNSSSNMQVGLAGTTLQLKGAW